VIARDLQWQAFADCKGQTCDCYCKGPFYGLCCICMPTCLTPGKPLLNTPAPCLTITLACVEGPGRLQGRHPAEGKALHPSLRQKSCSLYSTFSTREWSISLKIIPRLRELTRIRPSWYRPGLGSVYPIYPRTIPLCAVSLRS
jgi:hypothetical protein